MAYSRYQPAYQKKRSKKPLLFVILLLVLGVVGFFIFGAQPTVEERAEEQLTFDDSVSPAEQEQLRNAIIAADISLTAPVSVSATTSMTMQNPDLLLDIVVPVTDVYSVRQQVTASELTAANTSASQSLSDQTVTALQDQLSLANLSTTDVSAGVGDDIVFISPAELSPNVKLLSYEGSYYLDDFTSGGYFREFSFMGEGADLLTGLTFNDSLSENEVFTTNITGVTALTRVMMRKLAEVGDPLYFSADIGEFLGDADLTHVSNEVSFRDDCTYNNALFCSPPEFIETLKASGVDLVEITGNHNNDFGSALNTATIELYNSLGWGVVGGGLNAEAAKAPFISNEKGSSVAFLAYNYPDAPNGGAIAGATTAGANPFDFSYTSIETDIAAAKQQADFVIVNIQYWECYAYPDGYVEFPECDVPIGEQEATFKQVADLGADMVVGTSAHQPQTYEIYNGVPIYYGLGNLYFDQTSWPGTERGIVLTNYFVGGELMQTKLTGTVYDDALQTRVMTPDEETFLLTRLQTARN